MGGPGAACHAPPVEEVQADCGPRASQPFRPRVTSTGAAPGPGATPPGRSAARAQVWPPSRDTRISGRDSEAAPCEPTATMVLPASAIPVSDGGRLGPVAGAAKSPAASLAAG